MLIKFDHVVNNKRLNIAFCSSNQGCIVELIGLDRRGE